MYKGREGQWAFTLHRLSGMAILVYLLLHVFSIGSMVLGEELYMRIHETYDMVFFRLGLVGVVAAVVYHSMNGLRIILMDFTSFGVRMQAKLFWVAVALSAAAAGYALWMLIPRIQGGY